MSRIKKKAVTTKSASNVEMQNTPDLTPLEAKNKLIQDILDECIKIEEERIRTVYPLTKLTAQYKELIATSKFSQ